MDYSKYVEQYAKRLHKPFVVENIFKIFEYKIKDETPHLLVGDEDGQRFLWNINDCVIITNEDDIVKDRTIVNVNNPEYTGYNPFTGQMMDPENLLKKKCMGIVNQLYDLAEVPVEKRQKINDVADKYVFDQIINLRKFIKR